MKIVSDTTGTTDVALKQIRSKTGPVLARVDIPDSREQFYLSYHRRDANLYDGVYMGEGLLIWHRRGNIIDLECAVALNRSGRDHLDEGVAPGGLPTDFFNANRSEFTPTSVPNSDRGLTRHDSRAKTGIAITDIHEHEDRMIFRVSFDGQ